MPATVIPRYKELLSEKTDCEIAVVDPSIALKIPSWSGVISCVSSHNAVPDVDTL